MGGFLPGAGLAFEQYVAPARKNAEIWRLLLGILIAAGVWFGLFLAGFLLIVVVLEGFFPQHLPGFQNAFAELSSPPVILLFLLTFGALVFGLWLAVTVLHKRPFATLFGRGQRIQWSDFRRGVIVIGVVTVASALLGFVFDPPLRNTQLATWFLWLIPVLPAIFLQTLAEELAFRGYLQQQLAALSDNRLIWWLLPSLLFGALHWNPETFGANAWLVVAATVLMGLIAADVTARTGNISLSLGLHFANNCSAILFIAIPGPMSGLSLWTARLDLGDVVMVRASLISSIATYVIAYGVYLLVVARRRV